MRTGFVTGNFLILYCGPLLGSSRLVFKAPGDFRIPLGNQKPSRASRAIQGSRRKFENRICDRKNLDSLLWATVTVFQVSMTIICGTGNIIYIFVKKNLRNPNLTWLVVTCLSMKDQDVNDSPIKKLLGKILSSVDCTKLCSLIVVTVKSKDY